MDFVDVLIFLWVTTFVIMGITERVQSEELAKLKQGAVDRGYATFTPIHNGNKNVFTWIEPYPEN